MNDLRLTFPPQKTAFSNNNIDATLSILGDQRSRNFLQQHHTLLSNGAYINNFSQINGTNDCYQHPDVKVEPQDKIISINPMLGRPLRQFVTMSNHQCQIHCFEENPLLYSQLCKNIVNWEIEKHVVPVCNAVHSNTGIVLVDNQGACGYYNNETLVALSAANRKDLNQAAYAFSLDDYIAQTGFNPTMIECSRPGMAEHILKGGQNSLKQTLPKLLLAASPYSDIARQIKQLSQDYRIYYSESGRRSFGIFFAKCV
tara:strand:+ start:3300 stop:4070 length:771 start_codon:yes stop_codon:yes gene_type:complete